MLWLICWVVSFGLMFWVSVIVLIVLWTVTVLCICGACCFIVSDWLFIIVWANVWVVFDAGIWFMLFGFSFDFVWLHTGCVFAYFVVLRVILICCWFVCFDA